MLRRAESRGFTLIELMIGIALLGVLLALAAPDFSAFLTNQKVRGKAESILAGLQSARNEALRRNATVSFILTAATPAVGMPIPAADAAGPNWIVAALPAAGAITSDLFIDSYVGAEGAGGASGAPVIAASAGTVVFTPLGQTTGAAAVIAITPPTGACQHAGGDVRCLNIEVSPTGQVLMCDPHVTAAGDTRRCPSVP